MAYRRFLVCESDELAQQCIREVVTAAGHEVVAVSDAAVALDALAKGGFSCAFVDIDRLDANAFEIAQGLRGAMRRPRLVAMTARGAARDFELAKDAGFDICVHKPLAPTPLAVTLARLRIQPWLKRPPWKTYGQKR